MDQMVPLDGGEVWLEDTGGSETPAVLLHPEWGDARIWDGVMAQLTGNQRLIRYDARGYHHSPAPTKHFSALGDLESVLDELEVRQSILVGHSGSGATAMSFALAHPDRVAALLLLTPSVDGYPWPPADPFRVEMAHLTRELDLDGAIALGLRTWARAGADAGAQAQIRSAVPGMAAQLPFLLPDPSVFDRLAELGVPSSVLVGDLEYPMNADCAAAVARRIPDCRMTVLAGVDHLIPLRAPGPVAALIAEAFAAP